jgi:hypothetical protein
LKVFNELFPGKATEDVTILDFKMAAHKLQQQQADLTAWTFGGLVLYKSFYKFSSPC